MMMNDSAAEFVIASNVAFIDSDESYKSSTVSWRLDLTYHSFFLDNVDRWVDVVLCRQ